MEEYFREGFGTKYPPENFEILNGIVQVIIAVKFCHRYVQLYFIEAIQLQHNAKEALHLKELLMLAYKA